MNDPLNGPKSEAYPFGSQPAPGVAIDAGRLRDEYYARTPDAANPGERVSFGTDGHRGSSIRGSFNEAHVAAMTQAVCDYRGIGGCAGPLYLGKDSQALSNPAFATALEVLAGNRVETLIDGSGACTPMPTVSHAILQYNRTRTTKRADGIVITSSHYPPEDGGFKYNPPSGGPADTRVTRWIETRANHLLTTALHGVRRLGPRKARRAATTHAYDYIGAYVGDLGAVVDLEIIRDARLRIGVDALGGTSLPLWQPIVDDYGLDLALVDRGMDASLEDRFDIGLNVDPDCDRPGLVTRGGGPMPPNHYLAAAIAYLFTYRPMWRPDAAIGKTVLGSSLIDRVAAKLDRRLFEVPAGFKWFVPGLMDGWLGLAGDESARASFLRREGTVWTTDKDGIVMGLLAVEMTARTGRDPFDLYRELTQELGAPVSERIDTPATAEERALLPRLSCADLGASELAGDPIEQFITVAPGNGAKIGGLKVVTAHGWFAAIPSGTEAVYTLHAESFLGRDHLARIQEDARALVGRALSGVTG